MGLERTWSGSSKKVRDSKMLGGAMANTGSAIGDAIQKIGMKHVELKKAEMDHTADVYKRAMEHQNDMEFLHNLPEHARSFTRVHGVSTTVDLGEGKPRSYRSSVAKKPSTKKPAATKSEAPAAIKKPTVAAVTRQNKAAASYVTPALGRKLAPEVKAQNAAARSYITRTPAAKPAAAAPAPAAKPAAAKKPAAKPKQALKTKAKKDD
jgi:hypothetical protein